MRIRMLQKLSFGLLGMAGVLAMVPGCGTGLDGGDQTGNNPPVANAGANQSVSPGSTVTLNGAGSFDPDGDALTFSWSQIGGTSTVALSNPSSAATTFTAPGTDDTLQFELSVSDGQLTDTDTMTVTVTTVTPPPVNTPTLFITNVAGNNVTSYSNPSTVNGNIPPTTNLAGAQTQIDGPVGVLVDSSGALSVSNLFGQSITSYDNAVATNGNLAPDRNVQGAATGIIQPREITHQPSTDLMFLSEFVTNQILVFGNASSPGFNGNLAPVRTIFTATTGDLFRPRGLDCDDRDDLYVANDNGGNVLVFANASNLNGDVAPTRIIESAVFNNVDNVRIDGNDRMFVLDRDGFVFTFNNASTLNGNVAPDFTLQVQVGGPNLRGLAIDSNGTGYLSDLNNDAIYSYDNMGTLNGALVPDRTIQGAATQLGQPRSLYVLE